MAVYTRQLELKGERAKEGDGGNAPQRGERCRREKQRVSQCEARGTLRLETSCSEA